MKNKLILLAFLCLCTQCCDGQIVLTAHSFSSPPLGRDSLKISVHNSFIPVPVVGPGQLWDFSGIIDSIPLFWGFRVAAPPYTYADSDNFIFSGFNFQCNLSTIVSDSGVLQYEEKIPFFDTNIIFLTSGAHDTFYIPAQTDTYSAPHKLLSFPLAYGSQWSSTYRYDLNFQLTYQALGFNKVPGTRRTYVTEKDSVTGWGGLRIPDASGLPTPYLNVLQVQRTTTTLDSFFFNGGVMPGIVLTFFSVQQAQKDTTYEELFYRSQEISPLASVKFQDATFSRPYQVTTLVQQLSDVAVPEFTKGSKLMVYPNPVCAREVFISLPAFTGTPVYKLIAIDGLEVLSGEMWVKEQTAKLELPSRIAPGVYTLLVHFDGSPVYSAQLIITK